MSGLLNVSYFLLSLLFSFTFFILWLRIALRFFRISHLHPVSQVVYRITGFLFSYLDKWLYPRYLPKYDWVCLIVISLLECLKFIVFGFMLYGRLLPFAYIMILTLGDLISQPCNLLFYALIIRVILSWISPFWQQHPAGFILIKITDPCIRLGHKFLPNISGFDFSPLFMLIILKCITLFISASMPLPLL